MRFYIFLSSIYISLNIYACNENFVKASSTYKISYELSSLYKMERRIEVPDMPTKITKENEQKTLEALSDYYDQIYNYRLQFNIMYPNSLYVKELVNHSNHLVKKMAEVLDFKKINYQIKTQHVLERELSNDYI